MDERTLARFMSRVKVQPNGCWLRPAYHKDGYSTIAIDRRTFLGHRVSYEHFVGPIPEGLGLDHVCHTNDKSCPGGVTCPHRGCVNPEHLEPVTNLVNVRRGRGPSVANRAKTECVRGHRFTEENTYVSPVGGRACRTCREKSARAWVKAHHPGTRHGDETHCPQGHPYAGDNLIITVNGGRACRTCKRDWGREYMRKKRARAREAADA